MMYTLKNVALTMSYLIYKYRLQPSSIIIYINIIFIRYNLYIHSTIYMLK